MGHDVREVGKPGALGADLGGVGDGAFAGEVCRVRFVAQHVENQDIEPVHQVECGLGEFMNIGDIGQGFTGVVDAQTVGGDVAVEDGQGGEFCAEGFEGGADFDEGDHRAEEALSVGLFRDVREDAAHAFEGVVSAVAVDDLVVLQGVVAADVVEAEDVVGVEMGQEDRVDAGHFEAEALHAEVGARVDNQGFVAEGDVERGAHAVVTRVGARADGAVAADDGDTSGGARAEEAEGKAGEAGGARSG